MSRMLLSVAVLVGCCAAGAANAAPIVYTFESPVFTSGQTTPLLNLSPNVGPATFLTSFTDAATPNAYTISTIHENALMVGQSLFEPTAISALTLTFNTPVTFLSVDFAINTTFGAPGFLRLVTSSGSINDAAGNVGGFFPGGTLTFSSLTPFSSATLQGFVNSDINTQIEIDNLQLTPVSVPEPASLALFGAGAAALFGWRRKRKTRSA